MAGYDPSGNWVTDDGRVLPAQYTPNAGGFWYALDDKTKGGILRLPDQPPITNTDRSGPGGAQTTVDPLNPGVYWYRDDPNVSGGLQKIDAQGNVVGAYAHPGQPGEGGWGWNLNQVDPSTGGPQSQTYQQDPGGLFNLGPVWGGLLGTALVLGGGFGLGAAASALGGPALALGGGAAAEGAGAGAGAGAAGYGAAIGPNLVGAAGAPALAGGGVGALGAGAGTLGSYGAAIGPNLVGPAGAPALAGGGVGGAVTGAALGGLGGYAPLIGSAIGAGTSLAGGLIGANAATDAARIQAASAERANQLMLQMYEQNRADLAPYREAGYGALGRQVAMTQNPFTYGNFVSQTPMDPSGYNWDPSQYAFTAPSGQEVLNRDPGYAFRVSEGQKELDRQGAARGSLISGGQLKAGARFSQDLASQEYGAAYSRALTENDLAKQRALEANQLGYGRSELYNQQQQDRTLESYKTNLQAQLGVRQLNYGELAGISGAGQQAASQTGLFGQETGKNVGSNITSAGAAQAGGTVGAASALAGGIGGIGNAAQGYLNYSLLSQLLNQRQGTY
jgi:hypothetical protein